MTKNLPASYMYLGSLQTIEEDLLPQNDLDTNAVNLFGERNVFADTQDSRYLFVSEHIVGTEGAYDAYRVCRLYDEPLG